MANSFTIKFDMTNEMADSFTIKVVDLISNTCVECNRTFDMTNETESNEWSFGHDCEA